MEKKLQDGKFYWIKWDKKSDWEICIYDKEKHRFKATNGSRMEPVSVLEIDPTPIEREEIKLGDKVTITNDNETVSEGNVVDKMTIFLIEHDDTGETQAYADLGNWSINEVHDMDLIEKNG